MLRLSYLNTMRGLEEGLRVADIAVFELETCEPEERIADVCMRVRALDFDNVPVRQNGAIVGVVEDIKGYKPKAQVGAVSTALSEQMLVAGSTSLRSFLPSIADRPYRLVVGDSGIKGVVTPSDVVQLPVRLLVFALVAHLEEVMRVAIRQKQPDDALAVQKLNPDRVKNVRNTLRRQVCPEANLGSAARPIFRRHRKKKGLNPAALDITQFIDKANLG